MRSPADFIKTYFAERNELLRQEVQKFEAFRRKYHAGGSRRDKRREILDEKESEELLEILPREDHGVYVITLASSGSVSLRLRYCLIQREGTADWAIAGVDLECPSCKGETVRQDCLGCAGAGWIVRRPGTDLLGREPR